MEMPQGGHKVVALSQGCYKLVTTLYRILRLCEDSNTRLSQGLSKLMVTSLSQVGTTMHGCSQGCRKMFCYGGAPVSHGCHGKDASHKRTISTACITNCAEAQ